MPEELRQQVPVMKQVLAAMGICTVEQAGLEADDILGTLAKRAKRTAWRWPWFPATGTFCRSPESILRSGSRKRRGEGRRPRIIIRRMWLGVAGDAGTVRGSQGAHGDSSDNIPGVPKVGLRRRRN